MCFLYIECSVQNNSGRHYTLLLCNGHAVTVWHNNEILGLQSNDTVTFIEQRKGRCNSSSDKHCSYSNFNTRYLIFLPYSLLCPWEQNLKQLTRCRATTQAPSPRVFIVEERVRSAFSPHTPTWSAVCKLALWKFLLQVLPFLYIDIYSRILHANLLITDAIPLYFFS